MSRLSDKVQRVKPSPTMEISALADKLKSQGVDVIKLSAGEPDFKPPAFVKEALLKAVKDGRHGYTAPDGLPELKEAIQSKFSRENGLSYKMDEICVTLGGKQAIFSAMAALLNDGDVVVIPAPYWVSYPDQTLLNGGVPKILKCSSENDYKIKPSELDMELCSLASEGKKVKMFILNSPSNPSGAVYSKEELEDLADVLRKYPDIIILDDGIYEHLVYDGGKYIGFAQVAPDLANRTLMMNGLAKSYAMPGDRIGYIAGPSDIIKAIKKVQSQSTSSPNTIAQYGAIAALNGDTSFLISNKNDYQGRRDITVDFLNAAKGFSCKTPAGAFYAFADCSQAMASGGFGDDLSFAKYLLKEAELAVVPGSAFGAENHIRISYATSRENLEKAGERLSAAMLKI